MHDALLQARHFRLLAVLIDQQLPREAGPASQSCQLCQTANGSRGLYGISSVERHKCPPIKLWQVFPSMFLLQIPDQGRLCWLVKCDRFEAYLWTARKEISDKTGSLLNLWCTQRRQGMACTVLRKMLPHAQSAIFRRHHSSCCGDRD